MADAEVSWKFICAWRLGITAPLGIATTFSGDFILSAISVSASHFRLGSSVGPSFQIAATSRYALACSGDFRSHLSNSRALLVAAYPFKTY